MERPSKRPNQACGHKLESQSQSKQPLSPFQFCDASAIAYATVTYLVEIMSVGKHSSFIVAKMHVFQLKIDFSYARITFCTFVGQNGDQTFRSQAAAKKDVQWFKVIHHCLLCASLVEHLIKLTVICANLPPTLL